MSNENEHIPHPMDSTDEKFSTWLSTANMGEASSVENLLTQSWNQMKSIKDELMVVAQNPADASKADEAKQTLVKVYAMLQRMESRVFLCRDRKKSILANSNMEIVK